MAVVVLTGDLIGAAEQHVRKLFERLGEGSVHGHAHAVAVLAHARAALKLERRRLVLNTEQVMAVQLAALLHDVDDPKVVGAATAATPYHNARTILADVGFSAPDLVVRMIDLVSFSKNGNSDATLPFRDSTGRWVRATHVPAWMLIPRYADRLEAIGATGVARCAAYGLQVGRPLVDATTPRPRDRAHLRAMAMAMFLSGARPTSTVGYFIAGLVPRTVMPADLRYFSDVAAVRARAIEQVCLEYGATGVMDLAAVRRIVEHADDGTTEQALAILDEHRAREEVS
jgi:uncharacterized protein